MPGRKVGIGFNAPRVLGGRLQHDYRRRWDLMRRLTRLDRRGNGPRWQLAASVVEMSRRYLTDK